MVGQAREQDIEDLVSGLRIEPPADLSVKAEPNSDIFENSIQGKEMDRTDPLPRKAKLPSTPPANDDLASIGNHLRELQQKDKKKSNATLLGVAFAVSLGVCAIAFSSSIIRNFPVRLAFLFYLLLGTGIVFAVSRVVLRQISIHSALHSLVRAASCMLDPEMLERRRVASVPEAFKSDLAAIEHSISRLTLKMRNDLSGISEEIGGANQRFVEMEDVFRASVNILSIDKATMAAEAEALQSTLRSIQSDVSKNLRTAYTSMDQFFETKSAYMLGSIERRNKEFLSAFTGSELEMRSVFLEAARSHHLKCLVENEAVNEKFIIALSQAYKNFDEKLEAKFSDAIVGSDAMLNSINDRTISKIETASVQANMLMMRAEEASSARFTDLQKSLASDIIALSSSLKAGSVAVDESLEQAQDRLTFLLKKSDDINNSIKGQVELFDKAILQPLDKLTIAFGEKSKDFTKEIVVQIGSLNDAVASAAGQVNDRVVAASELLENVARRSGSINEQEKASQDVGPIDAVAASVAGPVNDVITKDVITKKERDPPINRRVENKDRQGPGKQSSWISELLARVDASTTSDITAPHQFRSNSIEAISKIVDQIDHSLPSDMTADVWRSYAKGEKPDFLRCFSATGLRDLAIISHCIVEDKNLETFVRGYISKFEKLVHEAYADSGEDPMEDYMISSGGKIYTMLAKAVDRI